jgi:hypothetical protein
MPTFPCTSCGACCKSLKGVKEYKELDRGDGVCIYFDENNLLCSIYEKRPLKCRVDEMYYLYFKGDMTLEEYYNINVQACNLLQEKQGVDPKYKIGHTRV